MRDTLSLLGFLWGGLLLALPGALGLTYGAWWVFQLGWPTWLANVATVGGIVLLLPIYVVAVFVPIMRRLEP